MLNTQFDRPATVLLSVVWTLAAVLTAAALAVSSRSWNAAPAPVVQAMQATSAQAKSVERFTRASMLGEPRRAIGKDKLE